MRPIRDLLKHGATYGVGQILGRLASFLLLPVYTRLLAPADYGVIAVLDLVTGMLSIVVGAGMVSAVNRFHFDGDCEDRRNAVWWTGTVFVGSAAAAIVLPLLLFRDGLAHLVLGPEVAAGGRLFAIAAVTLWFGTVGALPEAYLRVRKWSGTFVVLSLGRLVLNVGLNVTLLVVYDWGVEAVLWGNLATSVVVTLLTFALQAAHTRPFVVDGDILRRMLAFGGPLILTAFLGLALHDADRLLLRLFAGMGEVGVYSFAYKIAQAISTMLLAPFAAIWSVSMYEIAALPDGRRVFATVFDRFARGIGLVMLAASLFARPILAILVPASYAGAADLVPVICLAYFLFSLNTHFSVPVMLSKSTGRMVPVYVVATLVNVLVNLALIPSFGAMGAAWASVVTFAVYSFGGLLVYRQIERIPYDLPAVFRLLPAWAATYFAVRLLPLDSLVLEAIVAAAATMVWAALMFGSELQEVARQIVMRCRRTPTTPEADAERIDAREPIAAGPTAT